MVVAVDDAGADDEPGQKDLNWLSIDYGAPGATSLTVKWGWDDTATSGANTRDAGSPFDTDGDGFNYSLYDGGHPRRPYTTQLYPCAADNRTDRCAGLAGNVRLRRRLWPFLQIRTPSACPARRTTTRLT